MSSLKLFLDHWAEKTNRTDFIENDPVSIPHQFSLLQDIEIIGLWVALLSWGRRETIIKNGKKLVELLDGEPYAFILHHQESDRKRFLSFVHRTFQPEDALCFLSFFQAYYREHESLETAFFPDANTSEDAVKQGLIRFQEVFFSQPQTLERTRKHVASPLRKSTCKRLNMFLRWMVRKDNKGVDFGLWNRIQASQLMLPLDVHVERVARHLGLLQRKQRDWLAVEELTSAARQLNPDDPAYYDFALFGIGLALQRGRLISFPGD